RLMISMPVRSPLCTVRSKLWPANALPCSVPSGLRSKKQPISFSSSRTRSIAVATSAHANSWCGSHLPPSIVSMKCRSTESPGLSATLYPPCTMRVQPHLPSNPLVAMVTSRSGSALSACSAANNPAPPEPRIKMSVARRSTAMRASKHTRQQDKGDDRRDCRRNGRQLFLPMVPSEILDQEHAHASQHVHHEQKDEAAFGKLHHRLIAPAQKLFERGLAFDCKPERQEVERKENGERQAGQPVH